MSASYDRIARPQRAITVVWPLLLLAAAMAFLVWWFWPARSGLNPEAEPRAVTARGVLADEEKSDIAIYERAAPSVVHVTNIADLRSGLSFDLQQIPRGTGSGFVWDEEGHIVTNYHVVNGADAARVILADQSTFNAQQVWGYPDKDIAVLWIDAPKSKLRPILIGSSHDLKVGQIALAIGNPFGLDQTMTTGIVSGLGREIQAANGRPILGAIQTSAAINPGNSGGPLLDSAGRLIGMNTSIISPSGAFAGIGFAIPVDEINQIVPQLIRNGKVVRPRLGIRMAEDQTARQLGVQQGVLIINVEPKSPAAKAGLKGTRRNAAGNMVLGDVIVAVDDKPINDVKDLFAVLERYNVGDTATLAILRDGQRQNFRIALEAME